MQFKCVIIDDEPLALTLIASYMERLPQLQLLRSFDDAIAGAEFLRHHPVDLVFLDIQMPDISGLDLVRSLPQKPLIIFTTAHRKFALDGFELDAADYLLKPISFERFERAVTQATGQYRLKESMAKERDEALFVRAEYQLVKIDLSEIEYIESVEDYIKIHRTTGRPVMTLMTLKKLMEKLPSDRFKRIHRSYVIPLSRIRSFVNRKVRLTSAELPVSDSYANAIQAWIKK
jgi:DNA-binding LytR/AlgR family response regulator